jgi:hypothetical protein
MAEVNPAGTMFLGLVDELMDLVKNADVSRIEVVMAGYELDRDGEKKLINGKHSIAQRAFKIRGMNKDVQRKTSRTVCRRFDQPPDDSVDGAIPKREQTGDSHLRSSDPAEERAQRV